MATNRYIKKDKKEKGYELLVLLTILFAALGTVFSFGAFSYGSVLTILITFYALSLDKEDLLCLIMFAFPFSSMLKLSLESISFIAVFCLLMLFKLFSDKRISVSPTSLLCFILFIALQVVTILIYDANYMTVTSMLISAAFVMFVSAHFGSSAEENQTILLRASLCFSIGTSLMLLLSDLFPRLPYQVHPTKYAELVAANRYGATILDPNELAQVILIAIGLLIAVIPSLKSKFTKFLSIVLVLYMAITGIRTNSKSYVLSIVLLFAFLMFLYIRMVVKKEGASKAFSRFLPVLLVAAVGCAFLIVNFVIPVFDARSSEQTDMLTNRTGIWESYIQALSLRIDVMLFGCGPSNVTHLMKLMGRITSTVPHNTYLEYVIQFGGIGLILLFVAWKATFKQIKAKMNSYYVLPLVAFLITAFGISVNANDCPYILLALLSLPLPTTNNLRIIEVRNSKRGSKYVKKNLS